MPAKSPRITTVVDEELARWLRRRSEIEGRSVSLVVRDIIAKQYEDEDERLWVLEGENRLATFDRHTAVPHEDAWVGEDKPKLDPKEIRRRQLAEVLSHQGKIELDIDSERLSELRK